MPEGPECHKLADHLDQQLRGKILTENQILGGRYFKHGPPAGWSEFQESLPTAVRKISCKGKLVWFIFENGWYMMNGLGMNGRWMDEQVKHANVQFVFGDENWYFVDSRNFGTLTFTNDRNVLLKKLNGIGPDMLHLETTLDQFFDVMEKVKPQKKIGEVLLDQSVVSGIGNYLRADSLYLAGLSPWRTMVSLSRSDLENLYRSIRMVMFLHYDIRAGKKEGIIPKSFKVKKLSKAIGYDPGDLVDFLVYGKKTIQGKTVKKEPMSGRTIHWVPEVQT